MHIADGEALDIMGVADVPIIHPNSNMWTLQKARHTLKLKIYLISLGKLDNNGHLVFFSECTWKVMKGAMVLAHS